MRPPQAARRQGSGRAMAGEARSGGLDPSTVLGISAASMSRPRWWRTAGFLAGGAGALPAPAGPGRARRGARRAAGLGPPARPARHAVTMTGELCALFDDLRERRGRADGLGGPPDCRGMRRPSGGAALPRALDSGAGPCRGRRLGQLARHISLRRPPAFAGGAARRYRLDHRRPHPGRRRRGRRGGLHRSMPSAWRRASWSIPARCARRVMALAERVPFGGRDLTLMAEPFGHSSPTCTGCPACWRRRETSTRPPTGAARGWPRRVAASAHMVGLDAAERAGRRPARPCRPSRRARGAGAARTTRPPGRSGAALLTQ